MEPSAGTILIEVQRAHDSVVALRDEILTKEDIADAVRQGMVAGARAVAHDGEFAREFWERGYAQLSEHAGKGASQWVGKRILTWLATALVGVLVVWLVRSGALK